MLTSREIERAMNQVRDQQTFLSELLGETLGWPTSHTQQIDEIAFGWTPTDLKAVGLEGHLLEGSIWQLQPGSSDQPWGIFILEFKHEDALSPRRGMAGVLRKVLRGLVANQRKRDTLPSWKREHLLFICTYKWTHFRFAYFRPKPDEPRSARLTTFGWAPNTSNRTLCEFNLPALIWPDDPSEGVRWVENWAKAFDKEPLTRDFFKRFDTALDAIKADLEKNMDLSSSEAYTQSQLLLERLIFIYFLQNRGWLNRDRYYLFSALKKHLNEPEKFTYYQEFLDRLFWTLATAPGSAGRLHGVPFLNGGLFDDDEFHQPADLRKVNPPLKVRNGTMQGVFSDLLEAFNFTVTEDTPLNQEVAVDPEMLGKVFESIVLHAEAADPDANAPDKRKATGSYYTPRIVVHFICREVLYQYLLGHLSGDGWGPRLRKLLAFDFSDGLDEEEREPLKQTITPDQARKILELVKPLKCCDPAVGSGAFPVGLMQELVNLRRLLETALNGYRDPVVGPQGSSWLHDTKAQIVEDCLFGVDIQQQAIEICRLRLWLSLVVDYDLGLDPFGAEQRQFVEAIERMSQLPNLEMNFRRGDSLHDHISGVPVVILPGRASHHTAEFTAIAKLGADLHRAKKAERKKKLRLDILEKRLELSRKIVNEELQILRQRDSALDTFFGDEESDADKRKRSRREIERLEQALTKIEADQKSLKKLRQREADPQFYPKLRKLEGADFDSPFNFAWSIDFPGVYGGDGAGFDVIVGNPPFVTARNPNKREMWRQRWPRVSFQKYQLVAPFFECSFSLLKSSGQLGFIVSNGFAKREFGKPLVEDFLKTLDLQKIVDCSGLMFPGHGTPTCIVFAQNGHSVGAPIRMVLTLPGGGDLRTPPEESALWASIAEHHSAGHATERKLLVGSDKQTGFRKVYEDMRVAVGDCDRERILKHPCVWSFVEWPVFKHLSECGPQPLKNFIHDDVGVCTMTNADDIFVIPEDAGRRLSITRDRFPLYHQGEEIRDWTYGPVPRILWPYDWTGQLLDEAQLGTSLVTYLRPFREYLENRHSFGSKTFEELGRTWYEFERMNANKYKTVEFVTFPLISTHQHFLFSNQRKTYGRHAQVLKLPATSSRQEYHLVVGYLNSSAALFWLKQVCFSKREAEEAETSTYFEFGGGRVQQLPMPTAVAEAFQGRWSSVPTALTELSARCWKLGQDLVGLTMQKIFIAGKKDAYSQWISDQLGYVPPDTAIFKPFDGSADLLKMIEQARKMRELTSRQMVALQEEMDWLIYAACGVSDDPVVDSDPEPLDSECRPFRLWEQAERSYERAVGLIPGEWRSERKRLWQARLVSIRDNEYIRRIEQPVYKRRWDEQWKVGNQWRCGEIAYAGEFIDAFEWWLKEKAEWWLEHKKCGGPVELNDWTKALWNDGRIQAAWPVAAENYALLEFDKARTKAGKKSEGVPQQPSPKTDPGTFARRFKEIVEEETVPEGFEFGTDYDELEKKLKKEIPERLKKVRGNLNVPRERFHTLGKTRYKWAGLQFRNIVSKGRGATK